MSKFEVGDKVRVIEDGGMSANVGVGDTGKVIRADWKGVYVMMDSHTKSSNYLHASPPMPWWLDEHRLEPIEVHKTASKNPKVKLLHPDAVIPRRATPGSSGFDLVAIEDVLVELGKHSLIKTGLSFQLPVGLELQIRPRSGLSLKTGLTIRNSPGTVDQDFSGEVCVIMGLVPHEGAISYQIKKGDRIAQGVICPVDMSDLEEATEIVDTERGSGGFGSSGK